MADTFLERNIKELLAEFPRLGEVLSEYEIGCVTCAAGDCLLKDIVKFHYLPEDRLRELMYMIAKTINPAAEVEAPPCVANSEPPVHREINYSPPMKSLVLEHGLIKRFLALVPDIIAAIDLGSEADRQLIREGVDFIRSYADKFHHAKEEEVLFKRFDEELGIIQVMLKDHAAGRNHVKAILEAVDKRDLEMLSEHLIGYRALLSEHITKEDEILYPWMDRELSTTQVGELFREFSQADSRFDAGMTAKYERIVERLEEFTKGRR